MPKKKGELSIEERLEQSIVAKEEEPYKLPSNWVWTRLGDITEINPKKKILDFNDDEEISFVPMKAVSDETGKIEKIEFEKYSKLKKGYTQFIEEDVLFAKITPCMENGKCAIAKNLKNNIGYGTTEFHVLRCYQGIINKLLHIFLRQESFRKKAKYNMTGSVGFQRVPVDFLKTALFPLPPLEEQKRIVEKLDSLFEKIQKIKEIIEEVKEKTTSRREAILSKAFSGELTEKWRGKNHTENARELLVKINDEKLKLWEDECKKAEDEGRKKPAKPKLKTIDEMLIGAEEEPYKLPSNWVWTRLGDITNVVSGGTPSTSKEEYYNGNIPWITPKDLSNYKEKYILNGARNITEEGLKKSSAVLLPINSVLMSSRAPIGYVVINKKEVSTNQGFKSFTPSISYIPEYLYHYLKKSKNYLESIATGTTFKELSGDKAKKIIFPLPPLEEQKEIVRVLDKVFEEENRISELISLENKIEILEKTILDRAFRGELGTGNNDDEPAIELLKKCLEER